MALRGGSSSYRLFGLTLPLALLTVPGATGSGSLNCAAGAYVVGRAQPISATEPYASPDWDRLDRITALARHTRVESGNWKTVAQALRSEAGATLGPLSPHDLYWLGTSWWAFHQPTRHLHYPAWAPKAIADPDIALRHPEGGNCESSANGHATLLTFLGVPSRAVYGRLLPSNEGHVWTISDVDGTPMAADVHIARANRETRRFNLPWRPSPAQIQSSASYAEALRFSVLHQPENPSLEPIQPNPGHTFTGLRMDLLPPRVRGKGLRKRDPVAAAFLPRV